MSFIFAVSGQKGAWFGLQLVVSTVLVEATHPKFDCRRRHAVESAYA
jgi:hypothetical protein